MNTPVSRTVALGVALVAAACAGDPPAPTVSHSPGHPAENPRALFDYPAADGALKILSDHRQQFLTADGSGYRYEDAVCGVVAQIFASGSGDAVMDPDMRQIRGFERATCGDPLAPSPSSSTSRPTATRRRRTRS